MGEGNGQHRGTAGGPPRFFALEVTPHGTVLAGTSGRGTSRSTDGGRTWTPAPDTPGSGTANAFVAATDGTILAAADTGVYRSTDDGRSWLPLGLGGTTVFALALVGDTILAGTEGAGILCTIDGGRSWLPDPATVGLTVYRILPRAGGGILASTDGAGIWTWGTQGWRPTGLADKTVYALASIPPGDGVLAGTRGAGVWRSEDGGRTWHQVGAGLPDPVVHVMVTADDGSVHAGTGRGVARSVDGGRSWSPVGDELAHHRIFSLAVVPDGALVAGSYDGVWRRDPATRRWESVDTGLTSGEAYTVTVDPTTQRAFTATGGVVRRSADRGMRWQPFGTRIDGLNVYALYATTTGDLIAGTDDGAYRTPLGDREPRWIPVGLQGERVFCVTETGGRRLLAGTLGGGIFRCEHGDHRWHRAGSLGEYPLIFDLLPSRHGDAVFAATGGVTDGIKTGRILRSTDGGLTWTATGHDPITVYRVVESSAGVLLGGAQRCHILRSTDGGATWETLATTGLVDTKLFCLAIDGTDRLYLGAGARLLRSTDLGDTWTAIEAGLDGVTVYDLCHHEGGRLLAATSSGIYRSDDGDTWEPAPWTTDGDIDVEVTTRAP